jgi:hypothetical protein
VTSYVTPNEHVEGNARDGKECGKKRLERNRNNRDKKVTGWR